MQHNTPYQATHSNSASHLINIFIHPTLSTLPTLTTRIPTNKQAGIRAANLGGGGDDLGGGGGGGGNRPGTRPGLGQESSYNHGAMAAGGGGLGGGAGGSAGDTSAWLREEKAEEYMEQMEDEAFRAHYVNPTRLFNDR